MSELKKLAQPGVISDPNTFAEYLTFVLHEEPSDVDTADVMGAFTGVAKSIRQKDPAADLEVTIGFSKTAWDRLFADRPDPSQLRVFPAMQDGERAFPSTPGDIFLMIKSERMDLNFQAAKHMASVFAPIGGLVEDIQGFRYLDNRDMIDFVDGTENPTGDERIESVLIGNDDSDYAGGSYLTVQRYVDRQSLWDEQTTEYQERVIGRTKIDNIELDDDIKPAWAHNEKSKVIEDGEELKMLRQNRPFGNAMEHGTMFVGFACSPDIIETSLTQMITADELGNYDRLLDFVEAKSGANYFVPPQTFLDSFGD